MGILINTGFDLGSSSPIDNRTVKNTIDERDALVSEGKVYENLKVYCKDTQTEYRWTGTEWETVGSSGGDLTDYQKKTDNTLTTTDKTIVGAINEVKSDIAKKANNSDLTTHTSDTDIHITTSERTKWNEVDNKANDDEVVKKTDISTTIDSASTDDTVPSTKAVWDKILDSEKLITKDNDEWVISGSFEKICTTSVTDVPQTDITITGSNVSIKDKYNIHKYCVKNGICYVSLNSLEFNSNFSSSTPITTLPKPVFRQAFLLTNVNGSVILGRLNLQDNGKLFLLPNVTPVSDIGHISFSYPVAEQ